MASFHVYCDAVGQYRWRLKADNGEIVAASEDYVSKAGAKRSAERVKELAPSATIVDDEVISSLANFFNRR